MKLLSQYYNEQFKQRLDPVFEELGEEDQKKLEKIVGGSLGFKLWQFEREQRKFVAAIKGAFQKVGILKID